MAAEHILSRLYNEYPNLMGDPHVVKTAEKSIDVILERRAAVYEDYVTQLQTASQAAAQQGYMGQQMSAGLGIGLFSDSMSGQIQQYSGTVPPLYTYDEKPKKKGEMPIRMELQHELDEWLA